MEVSALAAATAPPTQSEKADATLTESFDTFLTLLTTQLRYQDPLEPMDSAEFTNQLVQFSQVEQSISTNSNLEKLLGFQGTNQAVAAISYIGNTVEVLGSAVPLVDGAATVNYVLPENAESAKVLIFNAAGQQVQSIEGGTTVGKQTVIWDGKDSDGAQLPDGAYTVVVAARDAENESLEVSTSVTAKVTGTQNDGTNTQLILGTVPVDLDKVISVNEDNSGSSGGNDNADSGGGGEEDEPTT